MCRLARRQVRRSTEGGQPGREREAWIFSGENCSLRNLSLHLPVDQYGNTVPNCTVSLYNGCYVNTGGHNHDAGTRPTSKYGSLSSSGDFYSGYSGHPFTFSASRVGELGGSTRAPTTATLTPYRFDTLTSLPTPGTRRTSSLGIPQLTPQTTTGPFRLEEFKHNEPSMHPYTPASRETQCKEKWGVGGIAQMFAQILSVNECE